ncbi:Aminotransferase [Candidatus Rhodobacter oscarellae]|uniref:Aminotransferase n=1 Tax=Candidatus Rhodobacter oscarellae TaxID=1675527 RepID=A0A0J9E3X0_9RHOB|nr:Aminotransferase [Candidatus Rhodobacter lobularis]
MKVPFLDVGAAYRELKDQIDGAVARVMESGYYIGGPEVDAFEADWARYCQADFAVGTGNGLDALVLALRALGIGPGDEVIVPANTFIATWLAVSAVGATIVPVDPDPASHNINANGISSRLSPATKAIIPVHLYGCPADLDGILDVAKDRGIPVIEDAAQAHGARYKGRRIGSHADIVCWSFYPGKNLGAGGDGGAITTNSAKIAERVRMLGNYGSRRKYEHEILGTNSRLDPLQAAILRVKLASLDTWTARRQKIARFYLDALRDADLVLPNAPDFADPVYHLFVVQHQMRDKLQSRLAERGIATLIHYPSPPGQQNAYRDDPSLAEGFPIAQDMSRRVLSLPMGPHLSMECAEYVAEQLRRLTLSDC